MDAWGQALGVKDTRPISRKGEIATPQGGRGWAFGPGKAGKALKQDRPYRKPTQVDRHKCAKARERTLLKELGKRTP